MTAYRATASKRIEASSEDLYAILSDYRNGHPRILPKPYFISTEVEAGGIGAGTIIRFQMRVLGQIRNFRAVITEPQPGRVLVETNLDEGRAVTTFTVRPAIEGHSSEVTIATDGRTTQQGIAGWLERHLTELYLRRIYEKELQLLAAHAVRGTPDGIE